MAFVLWLIFGTKMIDRLLDKCRTKVPVSTDELIDTKQALEQGVKRHQQNLEDLAMEVAKETRKLDKLRTPRPKKP